MKTHPSSGLAWSAVAATLALSCRLWAAPTDAAEFPHPIAVDLGATEFAAGDSIVITSLRGDRPHLESGGRYLLEGTYTLASLEQARLGWSITSRGPSGPTPVAEGENMMVGRGPGTFRLVKTFLRDGWPHVSFYAGRSHGGVYFGEMGREHTVLRRRGWSDFSERPRGDSAAAATAGLDPLSVGPTSADRGQSSGNTAIVAYLGDPVPLPPNLDVRYGPEGLMAAFNKLSKTAGYEIKKLAVDSSEFPCLVYGIIAGNQDFRDMQLVLGAMNGYAYGGSVVGRTGQGSTYFALNMTPRDQYPRAQATAAQRRLMVRLEMLAQKVR